MCSTKRVQMVVLFVIAAAFLASAPAHAGRIPGPRSHPRAPNPGVGRVLRGTYPLVGAVSTWRRDRALCGAEARRDVLRHALVC